MTENTFPQWLLNKTFVIQYNPNCHKPFLIRLCGKGAGLIDILPYMKTKDILGFGKTLTEAIESANKECYRSQGKNLI